MSLSPEENACNVEAYRIDNPDDNVRDAITIKVLPTKIETTWIKVPDHLANEARFDSSGYIDSYGYNRGQVTDALRVEAGFSTSLVPGSRD